MKDVEGMSKEEKHWYIFEDKSFENRPRVKWITDCLLGDIRTFLYGIENRIKEKHAGKAFSDGFGNLSVPVLISTALEFVAALYTGKTKYMEFETKNKFEKDIDGGKISEELRKEFDNRKFSLPKEYKIEKREEKRWEIMNKETKEVYYVVSVKRNKLIFQFKNKKEYKATENVKEFIKKYFPEFYKKMPTIFWDGVRNGHVHTFYPKSFEHQGKRTYIRFGFYVEDQNFSSYIQKKDDTIWIYINVFELFRVLELAIYDYLNELKCDEKLQDNFIMAWASIEDYIESVDKNQKEEMNELEA